MAFMTARAAQRRVAAPALIDEHGAIDWPTLDRRINRMIRALRASGLKAGDRIVLFAGNSRAVFELMIAAGHAGITYVPVNWHFTADELAHVMHDSEACGVFTDTRYVDVVTQALLQAPHQATQAVALRQQRRQVRGTVSAGLRLAVAGSSGQGGVLRHLRCQGPQTVAKVQVLRGQGQELGLCA